MLFFHLFLRIPAHLRVLHVRAAFLNCFGGRGKALVGGEGEEWGPVGSFAGISDYLCLEVIYPRGCGCLRYTVTR